MRLQTENLSLTPFASTRNRGLKLKNTPCTLCLWVWGFHAKPIFFFNIVSALWCFGFMLKRQTFLKTISSISCVVYYFKCEQNLLISSINLYHHNPIGESVRNFYKGVYFRCWFWLKRCSSHSKWPAVCTFVFLQILLARRLIRELILSCCKLLLSC